MRILACRYKEGMMLPVFCFLAIVLVSILISSVFGNQIYDWFQKFTEIYKDKGEEDNEQKSE